MSESTYYEKYNQKQQEGSDEEVSHLPCPHDDEQDVTLGHRIKEEYLHGVRIAPTTEGVKRIVEKHQKLVKDMEEFVGEGFCDGDEFELNGELNIDQKDLSRQRQQRHKASERHNYRESRKRLISKAKRKHCAKPNAFPSSREEPDEEPSMEDDIANLWDRISNILLEQRDQFEMSDFDSHLSILEGICILAYQVSRSQNGTDIVVALLAYIKSFTSGSICKKLMGLIESSLTSDVKVNAFPSAGTVTNWKDSFDMFRTNAVWKKISMLLTAAMIATACGASAIQWDFSDLPILSKEVETKQFNAVSFVDAAVSTIVWVYTTGLACIEEKSLKPILYGNQRIREFNEKVDWVLAEHPGIISGNQGEEKDFEKLKNTIYECLDQLKSMQMVKPGSLEAQWLQKKREKLNSILALALARDKQSKLKPAAKGFNLHGHSGVGKTSICNHVMRTALIAMGYEYDEKNIISKNLDSQYDEGEKGNNNGVIYNEVGIQDPKTVKVLPPTRLLGSCDNVPFLCVMPDVDSKGTLVYTHKVACCMSNFKDMNMHLYTRAPEAVLRRYTAIHVVVKPEFRKPGSPSLDPAKVPPGELPDCWELDFEEVVIFVGNTGEAKYRFEHVYAEIPDANDKDCRLRKCEKLTLKQALMVVAIMSKIHRANQDAFLAATEKLSEQKCCSECFLPEVTCVCREGKCNYGSTIKSEQSMPKRFEYKTGGNNPFAPTASQTHGLTENDLAAIEYENELAADITKRTLEERARVNAFPTAIKDAVVDTSKRAVVDYVTGWTTAFFTVYYWTSWKRWLMGESPISDMPTDILYSSVSEGMSYISMCLWAAVPDYFVQSEFAQKLLQKHIASQCAYEYTRLQKFVCLLSIILGWYSDSYDFRCIIFFLNILLLLWLEIKAWARRAKMRDEYANRRDALPSGVKARRDNRNYHKRLLLFGGATIASTVLVIKLYTLFRDTHVTQVNSSDKVVEAPKEDVGWFGFVMSKIGSKAQVTQSSKTAIPSQVCHKVSKCVFEASVRGDGGEGVSVNIYFLPGGRAILPAHVLFPKCDMTQPQCKVLDVHVKRGPTSNTDIRFKVNTSMVYRYDTEENGFKDFFMTDVPNCPSMPDTTQFFPLKEPTGSLIAHVLVPYDRKVESRRVNLTLGPTGHEYLDFYGGVYKGKERLGACMSPLVADVKNPYIVGFHIGMCEPRNFSVAAGLTLQDIMNGTQWLQEASHTLFSSVGETLPEEQYGRKLLAGEVHPKSNCLTQPGTVEVFGSTTLRAAYKSTVRDSILKESVMKHMGVEDKWAGAKMTPNWKAFNATYEHLVNPSSMFDPQLIERARWDYMQPLLEKASIEDDPRIRVLTMKEAIMGIPGMKKMSPLNMSTSCGFPLFGSKDKLFVETREGEKLIDREPTAVLQAEIDRMLSCWKRGERAFPVFSATLKDEVKEKTSEKVRVFQNSPIALTILIRMYFLSISHFLGKYDTLAESAVGVNAFGPDWDRLMAHALSKTPSKDHILGWDYKKFDVRMNAQMTKAVWKTFIDIAEMLGYADEDLFIMRMMVNDIVHPLIDWNGTMIMVFGINTSGNPMTVDVNGVCGSLYVRAGFFNQYPNARDFRAHVAALTYGDDFIGSVDEDHTDFNFSSFKEFMKKHSIDITYPDKSETNTKFLPYEKADFLKRQSNYIPEIGCSIGCLNEESILKSLMANTESAEDPRTVAAQCIVGAMHEWFAYGREHYEMRRAQMLKVCEDVDMPLDAVHATYDDRVKHWLDNYACTNTYFPDLYLAKEETQENISQPCGLVAGLKLPQSDDWPVVRVNAAEEPVAEVAQDETEQVAEFVDEAQGAMHGGDAVTHDPLRLQTQQDDNELANFLSRPVLLKTYDIAIATNFFEEFNPWELFLSNFYVYTKIVGYRCASMKLHFKAVINGSPFHYGRFMCSYMPMGGYDDVAPTGLDDAHNVLFSQRPHIFLNPTDSSGGEMVLPFLYHYNNLDLISSAVTRMGKMTISTLTPLKHANGGTDKVTVSFYAWAEDVVLTIPTASGPFTAPAAAATLPVKMAKPRVRVNAADEYSLRPISRPATTVAGVAGALSHVPFIGKFARATEIGAKSVAGIASLFGYSRPAKLETSIVKPMFKDSMAVTNMHDDVQKLSVDGKQELTIDPTVFGHTGEDEMTISKIASTESYLGSFLWPITGNQETLLWNCIVDPCVYDIDSTNAICMTAPCFATLPFEKWRGSLRYRFQVVASKYHRGRLKVVYDPVSTPTSGEANHSYNSNYTKIVDICDTTDFSVDIGWGQPRSWAAHNDITNPVSVFMGPTDTGYDSTADDYGNGVIAVYIVTELAVPDTSVDNDIRINVFVSAGDDFEVAMPSGRFVPKLRVAPELTVLAETTSDVKVNAAITDQGANQPETGKNLSMAATELPNEASLIHFGEKVRSFRQILKRYSLHELIPIDPTGNADYGVTKNSFFHTSTRPALPFEPGRTLKHTPAVASPVYANLASQGPYAYGQMTMLRYASLGFVGWRGGVRWLLDFSGVLCPCDRATVSVVRCETCASETEGVAEATMDPAYNLMRSLQIAFNSRATGQEGGTLCISQVNPTINFEVPYYSEFRFAPARALANFSASLYYDNEEIEDWMPSYRLLAYFRKDLSDTTSAEASNLFAQVKTSVRTYAAAAEDFQLVGYVGPPPMYFEAVPPSI